MLRTYTLDTIKIINLFEKITHIKVKDCIIENDIIFVVSPEFTRKAIGKDGKNVKRIEKLLRKKIKIVEYNENPVLLCKNLLRPLTDFEIEGDDENITITAKDLRTRGILIGRDRKNLKRLQNLMNRYFKTNIIIK